MIEMFEIDDDLAEQSIKEKCMFSGCVILRKPIEQLCRGEKNTRKINEFKNIVLIEFEAQNYYLEKHKNYKEILARIRISLTFTKLIFQTDFF